MVLRKHTNGTSLTWMSIINWRSIASLGTIIQMASIQTASTLVPRRESNTVDLRMKIFNFIALSVLLVSGEFSIAYGAGDASVSVSQGGELPPATEVEQSIEVEQSEETLPTDEPEGAATPATANEEGLYFETHVRPILREYCLDCHGAAETPEGSLDLRLVRLMKVGGDSGPAIDLEAPDQSEILTQLFSDAMPPGEAKVPSEKKEIIKAWIAAGAPTLRPEPETIGFGIPLTEEERAYWAYRPIQQPTPKTMQDGQVIRTGLDAVLKDAMPDGLTFSQDASRDTLIRRVYVDLTGLNPTFEEFNKWRDSTSEKWYENMVDELLASPHYGERWGRHWLDAAGYADSEGATINDAERTWAWRYRDYVIKSLNADKPFDRFIQEQLAGDELAGEAKGDWTPEQIECLTATGFLRMAADGTGSGDNSPEARNKTIADTVQIIGSTLLSSSLHCAQCHDHRYDPISHQDYFAIRSVLEPAMDWQNWKTPAQRLVSLYTQADRDKAAEIEKEAVTLIEEKKTKQLAYIQEVLEAELAKRPEELREKLREAHKTAAAMRSDEQKLLLEQHPSVNVTPGSLYLYRPDAAEDLKKYDARIAEVRAKKPAEGFLHALVEPQNHNPITKLFHRGDHNSPTREVKPGKLAVLVPEGENTEFPNDDEALPTTGRRLALARWLTDSENPNPLLLRSLVNRVWLHHFGKGIVATPGDFGRLGATPTNPKVLDWLASYWVHNDWSLKKLHKIILMSTVYRQSSLRNEVGDRLDPENNTYWRKPIQRLEAEVIRDSMLQLSATLNKEQFGAPLALQEDETGQVRIDPSQTRRSIYAKWRRSQPVALLQSFDAPVMTINCDIREKSTVPMQSLMLMNGDFALEQAEKQANRIINASRKSSSGTEGAKLVKAYTGANDSTNASDSNWDLPVAKSPWLYGMGKFDAASGKLNDFRQFPHFSGSAWQGGDVFPHPKSGYASLNATGGHPGNPNYAVVRRWIAPSHGVLSAEGKLSHPSPNGDGVRAIAIQRDKSAIVWTAKSGETATTFQDVKVEKGEVIDFVIDCNENETSDSFSWSLALTLKKDGEADVVFDFTKGFHGYSDDSIDFKRAVEMAWQESMLRSPSEDELTMVQQFAKKQLETYIAEPHRVPAKSSPMTQVLANICQMLTSSNEFLYVD